MKKLLVVLNLFLFACLAVHANKIDSLTNDADVKEFLHPLIVKNLYPGAGTNWEVKTWYRADFNDDNKTDLLVTEAVGFQMFNFAVLSYGNNDYKLSKLNYDTENESVEVGYIKSKPAIIFHGFKTTVAPNSKTPRTDTLVYQYGNFIEFNKYPQHYTIDSITFRTKWGWYGWKNTPLPPNDQVDKILEIGNGLKAFYILNRSNIFYVSTDKKRARNPEADLGLYHGKIKSSDFKEIYNLINYIDIKKLEDKYAIHYTDHTSFYITVKFTDGSSKTIADYGGAGTFGLQALFSKLQAMVKTTHWQ